jgi:hypothetical protein
LCANLARTDGRPATEHNARDFLADAGFMRLRGTAGEAFLGDRHALAQLEPDEVRSVEPVRA